MEGNGIMEMLQQYWYVIAVMALAIVISIVYNIVHAKKMKANKKNFLEEHPDAARIFLTSKALITSEAVQVFAVDGEQPCNFVEGGKTGLYVVPGTHTLQLQYTYSRPGVMYKNVTKSTGLVEKAVETAPRGSYLLGFDRKEETFTFENYNPAN